MYTTTMSDARLHRLYNPMEVEASPTSMVFSPEGVMLYVGTENGKIVVVDLRALDKGPRAITVSETGEKIASMCIQVRRIISHLWHSQV